MNNVDFPVPDNYSPESFGYSVPVEEKRGSGKLALFGCGGVSAALLFCCCCCVIGFVMIVRLPLFAVLMWGSAGSSNSWDVSLQVTCDGSQAKELTQSYIDQGSRFTSFNLDNSSDLTGDTIKASGVFQLRGGEVRGWSGTFHVKSGGTFLGKCIDTIDVAG